MMFLIRNLPASFAGIWSSFFKWHRRSPRALYYVCAPVASSLSGKCLSYRKMLCPATGNEIIFKTSRNPFVTFSYPALNISAITMSYQLNVLTYEMSSYWLCFYHFSHDAFSRFFNFRFRASRQLSEEQWWDRSLFLTQTFPSLDANSIFIDDTFGAFGCQTQTEQHCQEASGHGSREALLDPEGLVAVRFQTGKLWLHHGYLYDQHRLSGIRQPIEPLLRSSRRLLFQSERQEHMRRAVLRMHEEPHSKRSNCKRLFFVFLVVLWRQWTTRNRLLQGFKGSEASVSCTATRRAKSPQHQDDRDGIRRSLRAVPESECHLGFLCSQPKHLSTWGEKMCTWLDEVSGWHEKGPEWHGTMWGQDRLCHQAND